MTQGQLDLRTLDRLLSWLAVYVFLLATACWVAGVLKDLVPILTHLISDLRRIEWFIVCAIGAYHHRPGCPPAPSCHVWN